MAENFDDIFKALGKNQAKRGRKKGDVSPHTLSMDKIVLAASKKAKKVGSAQVFTLTGQQVKTSEGKPAGYDTVRAYAKRFCDANAGWVVAPKADDGTVVIVKR